MRKTHLKTAKTLIILFALGCGDFEMLEADGAAITDESDISPKRNPVLTLRYRAGRYCRVNEKSWTARGFGASSWMGGYFSGFVMTAQIQALSITP